MFAHLQKTMKLILPHSKKRWCCILGYFFISIEKNIYSGFFHLFEFQRLPSMATKHIVKRLLVTKYRYIMFLCEENIKWHPHDSQLHHYYPWVESQVSFISCIMEDSCSNYFFLLLGLEHGFEHVFLNMLKGNPLPSPNTSSAKSPGRP